MITDSIEEEILINGNRKLVIGVRCPPEQKLFLAKEANDLGITLSEHCENILLNREGLQKEKENALKEVILLKEKVVELSNYLANSSAKFQDEIEKIKIENCDLKKKTIAINDQVALFTDKRLLDLFAQVKGQKEIIETPEGKQYLITYDNPQDLLFSMIYSFQLTKSWLCF
jgi:hypothetical protein